MFYAQPWVDMHNRMKEALVLLGKLPRAVVRPPLVKIERAEIERIRKALVEAGLLAKAASARRRKPLLTVHPAAWPRLDPASGLPMARSWPWIRDRAGHARG